MKKFDLRTPIIYVLTFIILILLIVMKKMDDEKKEKVLEEKMVVVEKKRKQKEYKLTKKDWIEILEFWPLSIVVPAMLILIIFGSYLGV